MESCTWVLWFARQLDVKIRSHICLLIQALNHEFFNIKMHYLIWTHITLEHMKASRLKFLPPLLRMSKHLFSTTSMRRKSEVNETKFRFPWIEYLKYLFGTLLTSTSFQVQILNTYRHSHKFWNNAKNCSASNKCCILKGTYCMSCGNIFVSHSINV